MSEETTPTRRSVSSNTIKRGLAWVLALSAGALGLCAGYAIGERQTRLACLISLEASCPKLPTARSQATRGKGSDLRFYEDLTPERTKPQVSVNTSSDERGRNKGRVAEPQAVALLGKAIETKPPAGAREVIKPAPDERYLPLRAKGPVSQKSEKTTSSSKKAEGAAQSLQFGSFPARIEAERLVERLRAHDLNARVAVGPGPKGAKWFKVLVGHFPSTDAASQAKAKLGPGGTTAILVKDTDGPQ